MEEDVGEMAWNNCKYRAKGVVDDDDVDYYYEYDETCCVVMKVSRNHRVPRLKCFQSVDRRQSGHFFRATADLAVVSMTEHVVVVVVEKKKRRKKKMRRKRMKRMRVR